MGNTLLPLPLRAAWRNPAGLAVLGFGAVAAALTAWLPALEPWSGRAGGVFLLAALAYAATAAVHAWPAREAPEVGQLRRLRNAMAAQLAARRSAAPSRDDALTGILADGVDRLDREVIPATANLVSRNRLLSGTLDRFRRGELAAPDDAELERLRAIEARQRAAIAATTRQVAGAYASAVAIGQEGEADARLVAEAERWSRELRATQDALGQLLDETADWDRRLAERAAGA